MNDENLNESIDQLLVQSALNTVQIKLLTEMILNVYIETLPAENSKKIIERYFDQLIERNENALNGISNILIDQKLELRSKMDSELSLQQIKRYFLTLAEQQHSSD